jgi:predicted dehydrogenase
MGRNHQSSQGHAESTDANAGTPLRLGIIGFGRLAQNYYVPAFRRLSQGQVVAIADPLPVRQAAARAWFPTQSGLPDLSGPIRAGAVAGHFGCLSAFYAPGNLE